MPQGCGEEFLMNLDELLYEYIDENLSRVIISGAGKGFYDF